MPDKIASGVTYCLSGGLICNGLVGWYDWFHGLDWNFIGLVSGVVIGIATFLTNMYYKHRDDNRRETARRDSFEQDRLRTEAITQYLYNSPRHDEGKVKEVLATLDQAIKGAEK